MRKWWLILCIISMGLWITIGEVQAQDTKMHGQLGKLKFQDIEELSLEKLLEITITIAAGRAQTLEEAPGIVSVVTDEEIRRMGAQTLAEVLETVPGFEVLIGNLGTNHIIARGVNSSVTSGSSENVLILFNGHRLNEDIDGGATAINLDIPVENIKRVEIIRGPGSARFGANAFVGVINIVTYSAENFEGIEISAGGGSFDTQQYHVLTGYVLGDVSLSGFFRYADTDGPGLRVPADAQTSRDLLLAPLGIPPVSRAPGETVDDRRSIDANFQIAYKGLTLSGRFHEEDAGGFIGTLDTLGNSELENRQILLGVSYRYAFGEQRSLLATFSFTQNESRRFSDLAPPGFVIVTPDGSIIPLPNGLLADITNNSRRFGGEVILDYRLFEDNQLTLGLGFANESTFGLKLRLNADPFTASPLPSLQTFPFGVIQDSSRDIFSLFVQDIWKPFPQLGLTVGLRYDHYSDVGDTIDPRVGLVWRFAKGFHAKLLYGTAFRAPTFLESSFNIPSVAVGNPDLEPSTLQTFEAAVGYTWQNKLRITAEWHSVKNNVFVNNYLCWSTAGSFIRGKACFPEAKQRLSPKSAHVGGWPLDSGLEEQIAMSP